VHQSSRPAGVTTSQVEIMDRSLWGRTIFANSEK
jgi:hypothetical protein